MQYRVNHGGMDGIYAELSRRTQEVRALLDDLERSSRATLASWEGDAQKAYMTAKAEWDSAALAMATTLNTKSRMLNTINLNYQQGDRSAASPFR